MENHLISARAVVKTYLRILNAFHITWVLTSTWRFLLRWRVVQRLLLGLLLGLRCVGGGGIFFLLDSAGIVCGVSVVGGFGVGFGLFHFVQDDNSVWLSPEDLLDLLLLCLLVLMGSELCYKRLILEVYTHENRQEQSQIVQNLALHTKLVLFISNTLA